MTVFRTPTAMVLQCIRNNMITRVDLLRLLYGDYVMSTRRREDSTAVYFSCFLQNIIVIKYAQVYVPMCIWIVLINIYSPLVIMYTITIHNVTHYIFLSSKRILWVHYSRDDIIILFASHIIFFRACMLYIILMADRKSITTVRHSMIFFQVCNRITSL